MSKFDGIISEWIDSSLDVTKSAYHNELEPFSSYKERVKLKGIRAFNDYLNCIHHGYELILQRLEAEFK